MEEALERLNEILKEYGISSKITLEASQVLDPHIVEEQRKLNKKLEETNVC